MPSHSEMRVPPIATHNNATGLQHHQHNHTMWGDDCDSVPKDPRQWSKIDVTKWLTKMAAKHNIRDLKTDRFHMNGKALCLMTIDMYQSRVPLGGKLLFKDFQIRLARALYAQEVGRI